MTDAKIDIPAELPRSGGSFTRGEDGSLTQTAGPALDADPSPAEISAPGGDTTPPANTEPAKPDGAPTTKGAAK